MRVYLSVSLTPVSWKATPYWCSLVGLWGGRTAWETNCQSIYIMGNHKKTSPPNVKKCKQSLDDSYQSSDSEQDTQQPTSSTLLNVPRFLVEKSQEENRTMADLSHFVIEKCIQSIVHVGHPKTIKKLKSGDLLLEVDKKQQVENLLKPTRYLTSKSNYYYTILSDLPRVSFPARSYVLAAKRTSLKI